MTTETEDNHPPALMEGHQPFASFDVVTRGYFDSARGGTLAPGSPPVEPGMLLYFQKYYHFGEEAVGVHLENSFRLGAIKHSKSQEFIRLLDLRILRKDGKGHDLEEPMFSFIGKVINKDPRGYRGPVMTKVFVYTSPNAASSNARNELEAAFEGVELFE